MTEATSEETLLSSLAAALEAPAKAVDAELIAAGIMTGVKGARVSLEVGIEADAGRTIDVV